MLETVSSTSNVQRELAPQLPCADKVQEQAPAQTGSLLGKRVVSDASGYDWLKGGVKGLVVGGSVATAMNPGNVWNTKIITGAKDDNHFISMCKSPTAGLPVAVTREMSKNLIVFGTMPYFEQFTKRFISDESAAKGVAGALSALLMAALLTPGSNVCTRQQATSGRAGVWKVLTDIPEGQRLSALYRGVQMNALSKSIYFGSYMGLSKWMKDKIQENPTLSDHLASPWAQNLLVGSLAGVGAAQASYIPERLSKQQRISNVAVRAKDLAVAAYKQEGIRGLNKGFYPAGAMNTFIGGAACMLAAEAVEKNLLPAIDKLLSPQKNDSSTLD